MRFFKRQETPKPKTRLASRDRRGGAGSRGRQFAPWIDNLEDRVVLTVVTSAAALQTAVVAANLSPVDVTIDLNFSSGTLTAPLAFNPTTPGVGLDIVNIGPAVTIKAAAGSQILVLGGNAGAVGVDGQSALIELEGASTLGNGGAIADNSPGALSVTNVVFTGNTAANGGAIYAGPRSGTLTVADCKFGPTPGPPATRGNIATGVGGAIDETGAAPLTITNTTFVSNQANGGAGGAIDDSGTGGLTISANSVFLANMATNGTSLQAVGGAIAVNPVSPIGAPPFPPAVVIDGTSFLNNKAVGGASSTTGPNGGNAIGGAVFSQDASLAVTNTQFAGNQAVGGNGTSVTKLSGGAGGNAAAGALYSKANALENLSQNVTFLNNAALAGRGGNGFIQSRGNGGAGGSAAGGAVVDSGQGPDVIVASFYGNRAVGGAGGAGGVLGNGGAGGSAQGGALDSGSALSVSNSTFGRSLAQGGAGGAGGATSGLGGAGGGATGGAVRNDGSMQLSGTTFTDNSGVGGAGGATTHAAGVGGTGGGVQGGAVFNGNASLAITQNGYFGNVAAGGAGGDAVNPGGVSVKGGTGGLGGNASGGAVSSTGRLSTTVTQLGDNNVNGGAGGASAQAGGTGGGGGTAYGGAIDDDGYSNPLHNGTFVGSSLTVSANDATAGAGGAGAGTGGNGGHAFGGGMFAYDLQSQLSLSTFSLNVATAGAGGVGTSTTSTPGLGSSSFGGGLDNQGELTLTSDTFLTNEATGGAGYTAGNGNNGSGNGGGVANEILGAVTPALTVVDVTFTENTAQGGVGGNGGGNGGGLYSNTHGGVVVITQSIFRENSALGGAPTGNGIGGAIYSNNGGLTLTFSTVTLNFASTANGAYYSGGATVISFDTITLNVP